MSSESNDRDANSGVSLPKARPGKPGGKRAENRKERIRVLHEAALLLFLEGIIEFDIYNNFILKLHFRLILNS